MSTVPSPLRVAPAWCCFSGAIVAATLSGTCVVGTPLAAEVRRVGFDTGGARDPSLLALVERLKHAAEAGDAAAIVAAVAPSFRRYVFGIGGYQHGVRVNEAMLDPDEPAGSSRGIYGLVSEGGEPPASRDPDQTRRLQREFEEAFIRARDGYLVSRLRAWLRQGPVGTVWQMRSRSCLPADPVVPADMKRRLLASRDDDGSVTSSYAFALHDLAATDRPVAPKTSVFSVARLQIFELGQPAPDLATVYQVTLPAGQQGWVELDPDADIRPIFDRNFEGICFGKIEGEWKITAGAVRRL